MLPIIPLSDFGKGFLAVPIDMSLKLSPEAQALVQVDEVTDTGHLERIKAYALVNDSDIEAFMAEAKRQFFPDQTQNTTESENVKLGMRCVEVAAQLYYHAKSPGDYSLTGLVRATDLIRCFKSRIIIHELLHGMDPDRLREMDWDTKGLYLVDPKEKVELCYTNWMYVTSWTNFSAMKEYKKCEQEPIVKKQPFANKETCKDILGIVPEMSTETIQEKMANLALDGDIQFRDWPDSYLHVDLQTRLALDEETVRHLLGGC